MPTTYKLPTDLKVLKCIYTMYADTFRDFKREDPTRSSKIYIPIDVTKIASSLGADPHVLFGRLYYHLDHKYSYKQDDGSVVHLFAFKIGDNLHCINYPYLAAVLSEHESEHRRSQWALRWSFAALVLSFVAIIVNALKIK